MSLPGAGLEVQAAVLFALRPEPRAACPMDGSERQSERVHFVSHLPSPAFSLINFRAGTRARDFAESRQSARLGASSRTSASRRTTNDTLSRRFVDRHRAARII